MIFIDIDKLKALAIVRIFETAKPFGDYAAVAVLDDGAGVSYGINQFTHRSGSLAAVVETYLGLGATIEIDALAAALPLLRRTNPRAIGTLSANSRFKRALRAAAGTSEMRSAQQRVAFEKYLRPAMAICERMKFASALSLAVVYDSLNHGSWEWISRRVGLSTKDERAWITEYVRRRHQWLTDIRRLRVTSYRTKFFLEQIAIGNWDLHLPLTVHGVRLTSTMFPAEPPAEPVVVTADDQPANQPLPTEIPPETEPPFFQQAGDAVSSAATKFDRVDGIVTGFTSRRDSVKSLWATVIGTLWQAAWAVFGFIIGLPRAVWIVVAIIAAVLVAIYLYRQIALGRIRETADSTKAAA